MGISANDSYLRKSSGQAVLLVILGMAVVLTIVLSVVSRTVTDVSITKVEENSSKAFSAAEAGIERLLIGDTVVSGEQLSNNATIESAEAIPLGEGLSAFDFTDTYNNGDTVTIWFVSHSDDGKKLTCSNKPCFGGNSFNLFWNGNNPAIEVSIYYDVYDSSGVIASNPNYSGLRVKRLAFDPDPSRRISNSFSSTSSGQSGYSFSSGDISLSGLTRPIFARVKFIYASSPGLRVEVNGGTLPSQGRLLVSRGVSEGSVRQVEVSDYYRSPFGLFEAGLASMGDLSK